MTVAEVERWLAPNLNYNRPHRSRGPGKPMADLSRVLKQHKLDVSSLREMEESDDIRLLTVPGEEAIAVWKRLRGLVDETGHWPLLLGSDEDLDMHLENLEESDGDLEGVLSGAASIDPVRWFEKNTRGGFESIMGEWPDPLPASPEPADRAFTIPRDVLTREPFPAVHLALVPTVNHWEVPAYLRFGGFNDSPQPHEHVALWRRWHELCGAELVGISSDVIEALVSRPPTDPDGAMQLAQEQYLYCSDIVTQGVGTLSELAARLLNRPVWYFWWD